MSGLGAGLQAKDKGIQNLGTGIENVGQDLVAVQVKQDRDNIENAKIGLATDLINNRSKWENDTSPDIKAQWDADNAAAFANRSKGLPTSGPLADHWQATSGEQLAHESLLSSNKQHSVDGDIAVSGITSTLNTALTSYKRDPNDDADPTHSELVSSVHTQIDNAVSDNHMTREQGELAKQHAAKAIVGRHMQLWYQEDPEGFLKATGGWYPEAKLNRLSKVPYGAASVVAKAETDDPSLGPKALGNRSPDAGGSYSFGFIGLNTRTGSAQAFVRQYGAKFGLTAPVDSAAFNAQWHAAAKDQTAEFRTAQLNYFNQRILAPVASSLERQGIPEMVAKDQRVLTYFADRSTQMGDIGLPRVQAAWKTSGGNVERFLRNMNDIDRDNLYNNFPTATGLHGDRPVYGPQGHATRLNTRLSGALQAGEARPPVEPSSRFNEANEALDLTPQEARLYKTHLSNLNGPGGVDNPDGSRSSLFQMSFDHDGKTYNVPTVWDGKKHAADEAWARATKEGLDKFPSYTTHEEAEQRYQQMHGFMDKDTAEHQAAVGRVVPPGSDHPFLGLVDPADMTRYQAQARAALNQRAADELRLQNQQVQDTVTGYHQNFEDVRSGKPGATLVPLQEILDNPTLKGTPQGVALQAERRAIEQQMGQEVTRAQADASKQATEGYLSKIIAAQTGTAMPFEMPTHQEIDADPALTQADKNQLNQHLGNEMNRQRKEAGDAEYQRLSTAILEAANGNGEMPSLQSLKDNPVLGPHQADLIHKWYEANKQDQSLRAAILKYGDPNGGPFGAFDKDDRTNVDKIFQMEAQRLGDPMKAAQAVINRTQMMPQTLATTLRDALISPSAQTVGGALQMSLNAYSTNPHIFAGVTGGEELQKAALGYKHDIDIGYTAEKAAQLYIQEHTPEFKERQSKIKDEDIDKIVKDKLAPADITKAFNESWRSLGGRTSWGGPEVEFTEKGKQNAYADYVDLFKRNWMETADVDKSKAMALEQMKNTYGVTRFNGTSGGTFTKFAPEKAPAYAPLVSRYGVDKVTDKIADQAIADIKAANLPGVANLTRDKIMLTPTRGGQTSDAYWGGKSPPYQLSYFDDSGHVQIIPRGWVADADTIGGKLADEVKARGDAARAAAEPARARQEADITRAMVDKAQGGPTSIFEQSPERRARMATQQAEQTAPAETAEQRSARETSEAAPIAATMSDLSRSRLGSGWEAQRDVRAAASKDSRARAALRDELADLDSQERSAMRFPEGSAVRTTNMARIEQRRRLLEGRRAELDKEPEAPVAAPAEPATPAERRAHAADLDEQQRALDRREKALKKSGLGGAFLAAQSKKIDAARAELARERAELDKEPEATAPVAAPTVSVANLDAERRPAEGSLAVINGRPVPAPPAAPPTDKQRAAAVDQLETLDLQQSEAEALPEGKQRRRRLSRIKASRAFYKQQIEAP